MPTPRSGRPTPRMAETPSGMLNSIGLQGPGIDAFIEHDLAWLAEHNARTVVSIAGGHTDEYVALPARLAGHPAVSDDRGEHLLPERRESRGQVFACDAIASSRVISAVRRAADPAHAHLRQALARRHRHHRTSPAPAPTPAPTGFSLINTLLGMVDRHRHAGARRSAGSPAGCPARRSARSRCGASGRCTGRCRTCRSSGMGGIRSGLDALQFILAGASAVSVGTAVFGDPSAPMRVLAELEQALDERGFAALADAVGYAHHDRPRAHARRSRPTGRDTRPRVVTFGARLDRGRRLPRARCASASTRTPRCCRRGDCRTTPPGWPASPTCASTRSPTSAAVVKPQSAFFEVLRQRRASRCSSAPWPAAGTAARWCPRRQTRRHRLDDGGLRAGLPRPDSAAGRRRRSP